ncbi:MAG: SagB/ThcOx family dehydrogenase [Dysgonamonadaceae bacterium]|jgi:SagB-type dehydrogenase family enzyme|nr:SagB/ThcOx family dehydrogenase [Dysgonamonadaceae bacterium]
MNRLFLLICFFLCSVVVVSGQDVKLPDPVKTGGIPLKDALSKRQSVRAYSDKELSTQTLSDLLWAAYGFNRADKRVAPSSQNRQEIDLYVVIKEGIYLYDAKTNQLLLRAKGDHRKDAGSQDFVANTPLNVLYIANLDKASNRDAACMDCGFISQNIYLFCASEGLASVVRGSFGKDKLHKILQLTGKQEVLLAQTVGFAK